MRRLFWLSVGAAAGASGTIWTQRRVREHLDNLGPEQVVVVAGKGAVAAGKGARAVGRTVAAAVGEGRSAMAEREVELRQRLGVPPPARAASGGGAPRRPASSGTSRGR
jgi:hypothetical protein